LTFDVLLPAGGTLKPVDAEAFGTPYKSLAKVGGKTVLRQTFDAVTALGNVRRVVLAGEQEVLDHPDAAGATDKLPGGNSGPQTILNGLEALTAHDAADFILIVTTDLPFIKTQHLADFLKRCGNQELAVPVITSTEFAARFPGTTNTYIRLADGLWTAGCAYRVDSEAFRRALPHIEKAFDQRKSPIGMAKLLGPMFALRFLLGQLTVPQVLGKVESIIGCSGEAVYGCAPELAYDLDDKEDYEYAIRNA